VFRIWMLVGVILFSLPFTAQQSFAQAEPQQGGFVQAPFSRHNYSHTQYDIERALYSNESIITIQDALAVPEDEWQPIKRFKNVGFSDHQYWMRITLHNPHIYTVSKVLRFRYGAHDFVHVYAVGDDNELLRQWHLGDMQPHIRRPIEEKHAAVPIDLAVFETQTYYIAVRSHNALVLDINILHERDHANIVQYSILLSAMVYGILLVMALYNFGLAVSIKDKAYFTYVLYVLSFLSFIVILSGDGYYYLWYNSPKLNQFLLPISGLFLIIPSLFFPYHLLRINVHAPRIAKAIKWWCVATIVCLLLLVVLPIATSVTMLNVVSFLASLFMLLVGLYLSVRNVPFARIYTIAWLLLLIGFAVLPLSSLGLIESNLFTRNAHLLGGVLEAVILSFALSHRIRIERTARLQAVEQSLQAQRDANRSRKSFELLFQNAPVGMFRFNRGGQLLAVNPVFVHMLGLENEDKILDNPELVQHCFKDYERLAKLVQARGEIVDIETSVVRPDDSIRIVSLTLKERSDLGEAVIEGFMTDVTERKQHANMRRLMEEERFSSMEQLVTGVAHEVNTPLGNGLVAADHLQEVVSKAENKFLKKTLTKNDFVNLLKDSTSVLDILKVSLNSISQLISRFRQVSASHMKTEIESIEMYQHLNDLRELYLITHPELEINLYCEQPTWLSTYAGVWHTLLEQLINNSLQHGFDGQEHKRIDISLNKFDEHKYEWVYQDNGVGIPEQEMQRVFEPFVTTKRGAERHAGLGLYRVYNVVTQVLHGKVDILKRDGFYLRIEFDPAEVEGGVENQS